jgi:hypothetical protein
MTSGAKTKHELWKESEEEWRIKDTESESESRSGSSARCVTLFFSQHGHRSSFRASGTCTARAALELRYWTHLLALANAILFKPHKGCAVPSGWEKGF